MTTTLSTKLAALMLALAVNSVIMGSVALVFNARVVQVTSLDVAANVTQLIDRHAA